MPWIPSDIEQREGRIERQGNQNNEIELYGYATSGSMDATNWQMLERKARFINMAMSGDRSIRRIEDVGSNVNQFALAKALASGDERLMKKAGLDAEVARLLRLRDAHTDDQFNIRRTIKRTTETIEGCHRQIARLEADIARRIPSSPDEIHYAIGDAILTDRKAVGERILRRALEMRMRGTSAHELLGTFNGIGLELTGYETRDDDGERVLSTTIAVLHNGEHRGFEITDKTRASTVIGRIESSIHGLDADIANARANLEAHERRLPAFEARLGQDFPDAALLDEKLQELAELEAELAMTKGEFEPDNGDEALFSQCDDGESRPLPRAA